MMVSLLSLQGRASKNAEVASQLAAAADRIGTIGRIHPYSFSVVESIEMCKFKWRLRGEFFSIVNQRILT